MTPRQDQQQKSEPLEPQPVAELLHQARALSSQRHFDAALAVCDAALILKPDSVAAATLRGQIELAREAAGADVASAEAAAAPFVPAGTDPTRWQGFEERIRERRFRSLLETTQSAIDRRDADEAGQAIAEASRLRPAAPELVALDRRLNALAGRVILSRDNDALLQFASEDDCTGPPPTLRLTAPDDAAPVPVNVLEATTSRDHVSLGSQHRRLLPFVAMALVLAAAIGVTLIKTRATRSGAGGSVTQPVTTPPTVSQQTPDQQTAPQQPPPSSDPAGSSAAADGVRQPPAVAASPTAVTSNRPQPTLASPRSNDATRGRSTPAADGAGLRSPQAASPLAPVDQPSIAAPARTPLAPNGSVPAVPPPTTPPVPANAVGSIARPVAEVSTADRAAIQSVLNSYRTSYSRLDAPAVTTIWPSLDVNGLTRAFASLKSQEMAFDQCTVDIREQRAEARCAGELRYVPRVGAASERTERLTWDFELARRQREWTIEQVTAH